MATSVYFNNYNALNEQRVVEDLIVESIKIMGSDAFYLPNDNDTARDLLYGEDPVRKFQSAFPIEFYLSSALEYTGEREFFSKFGLEIKNNVSVIISKRSFGQRVPQNTFTRPREGDLIYVPFLNGTGELFEIKFTNQTKDFFMLGRKVPYFYELHLEKFKYSQEIISTGVSDIDAVVTDSAYTLHFNTGAGTGTYSINEIVYQSANTYANAAAVAVVQSWSPTEQTLVVTNIAGVFTNNSSVIGVTSGARYSLASSDTLEHPYLEPYDNKTIITSSSTVINTSETNALGKM